MVNQVCPRCQRANPGQAVYCWFDGIPLSNPGGAAAVGALPQEFVFGSGRRCRTFDELAEGCYQDWEGARELLRSGEFARFLSRAGRIDLARAAQEAQAQADPDIGLFNFVRGLPASPARQPRLELSPRRIAVGVLRVGESRQLKLTLTNSGQGVLQGKIAVGEGAAWLKIADGPDATSCPVRADHDQLVQLRVQTGGLVPQTYSGKLTVITNGGIAEVPVRLDVTAVPFAQGPLKGAASPREMAEKMRKHPKAAAPLLVSGEIARWFASNGWAYPVAGPPAPGVAAVQQFFECMGLSKPPPLQLSEQLFNFSVVPPESQRGQVTLRTTAKKWVYAQADSDRPWLRVTTPSAGGPQQAQFGFEVDSSLMEQDKVHEGTVQLIANAGQKLAVRVVVDVRRPRGSITSRILSTFAVSTYPAAEVRDLPPAVIRESLTRRLVRPLVVVTILFLLFRVLLVPPADLLGRLAFADPGTTPPGSLERWKTPGTEEDAYLKVFVLSTFWVGGVVGVIVVAQRGGRWTDYFCGLIAGLATGVAAAATLGCVLSAGDAIPRLLLRLLSAPLSSPPSPWIVTPLWLVLACACWIILGVLLGVALTLLGPLGARVVDLLGAPFAWLLRLCGLNRLAELFSP
jgi:hypothetical protein